VAASRGRRGRPEVSIIIPTYNEVGNIGPLIEALEKLAHSMPLELIVVDDGSTDGTVEVVKELARKYGNVRLLLRPSKMGLGSAYRDGLKLARGDVVVQMDADLSHRPSDLPSLLEALAEADVVVGSRYVGGGSLMSWGFFRRLVSKVANLLAISVLRLDVRDATSGFRAWKREAFEACVRRARGNSYDFQVETLCIAHRLGLRVREVPITFVGRGRGSSKLGLRDMLSFLKIVLSLVRRP